MVEFGFWRIKLVFFVRIFILYLIRLVTTRNNSSWIISWILSININCKANIKFYTQK